MGGRIVYEVKKPEPAHECRQPDEEDYDMGTVWLCDECSRFWELRWGHFENLWHCMTKREVRKLERKKGITAK